MRLTPLDIKKQEFKNAFRGYDSLEVETFLEMVANEYEELLNERNQLKNDTLILQTQLKDYQQVEQTLKQTLVNAQESVNKSRVNTEKEANLTLYEAELKAEKIIEKARRELEKIKNELILVRSQKETFTNRLKHLLESQIELIEVLKIDDTEFSLTGVRSGQQPEEEPAPQATEPEHEITESVPQPTEPAPQAKEPEHEITEPAPQPTEPEPETIEWKEKVVQQQPEERKAKEPVPEISDQEEPIPDLFSEQPQQEINRDNEEKPSFTKKKTEIPDEKNSKNFPLSDDDQMVF